MIAGPSVPESFIDNIILWGFSVIFISLVFLQPWLPEKSDFSYKLLKCWLFVWCYN